MFPIVVFAEQPWMHRKITNVRFTCLSVLLLLYKDVFVRFTSDLLGRFICEICLWTLRRFTENLLVRFICEICLWILLGSVTCDPYLWVEDVNVTCGGWQMSHKSINISNKIPRKTRKNMTDDHTKSKPFLARNCFVFCTVVAETPCSCCFVMSSKWSASAIESSGEHVPRRPLPSLPIQIASSGQETTWPRWSPREIP